MKARRKTMTLSKVLAYARGPVTSACSLLLLAACWMVSFSMAASMAATNLDLTSSATTMTAGSTIKSPVQIRVGTTTQTITGTTSLTPAEYLAAIQVATTGKQSIVLTNTGIASGGSFITNTVTAPISGIVIPSGVTAVDNFASASKLVLTGDFINSGTFYAVSNSARVTSATISANNILNQQGGLLSSIIPTGGIAGFTGLISNLSLNLIATNNIINHGTISSAAALNMTAGNSIINQTLSGSTAVMQAANGLLMNAPSINNSGQILASLGNINVTANVMTNSGLIQSIKGALSTQNLSGNALSILNTDGTISALNALSFSMSNQSTANLLSITGGTLTGSSLSLDGGKGNVVVNVVDVPKAVSFSAPTYDLTVTNGSHGLTISHTPALTSAALSYNGTGDVTFHGFSTDGGNVYVNTTGAISVLGPGSSIKAGDINTTNILGNAGSVTLDAGKSVSVANITTTGTGAGNGGDILLSAGTTVKASNLDASAGANGGTPGKIIISAGGTGTGAISVGSITDNTTGGTVSLSTPGTITINGNLTAPNGTISLGGSSFNITGTANTTGSTISLGGDDTGSYTVNFTQLAKLGGSTIQVGNNNGYAADIVLNSDCNNCLGNIASLTFDTAGHFVGTGHFITVPSTTDFSVNAAAGINTGTVNGGHSVSFTTQGALTVDGNIATTGGVVLRGDSNGAGNSLTIDKGISVNGSSILVSTGAGNVVDNGNLTATAGALSIASGGALTLADKVALGATGGNVGLLSAGTMTVGSTALTSNGGDVLLNAGGNINIHSGASVASYGKSGADGTYSGGQISVAAGLSASDVSAIMSSLVAARTGNKEQVLVTGGTLDRSNKVNSSGGSILSIQFPGGVKTLTNNTFNLNGGVIYIDPPGSNNVTINGATFTAQGQVLSSTGGTGGGGTGTGGTGSGTGGGTGTGGTGSGTGGDTGNGGTGVGVIDVGGGTLTGVGLTLQNGGAISTISSSTTAKDSLGVLELNQLTLSTNGSSILPSDSTQPEKAKSGWTEAIYCAAPGILKENETVDKDSWIIASNKCQPFTFQGPDGCIVIGTGPAIFAPAANHNLLLKEGKLLIIAGETMVIVRTPVCNITVPVNSAATVEYNPSGLARLTSFAGGKASVSVTRMGETMILSAAPGEQLVLAEDAVPQNEIVCIPDVTNKKLDGWMIRLSGLRGEKFTFERNEMVAREGLLNCTLGCFSKVQQSMLDQIRKSMMMQPAPKELKSMLPPKQRLMISRAFANDHLSPVGFGQILDLTLPTIKTLSSSTALVKFTGDASVSIESADTLNLRGGDVLVSTTAATTVNAGKYIVKLGAGTVAMISNRGDHVVVRNVFESKKAGATVVTPDKKTVGAIVGQELIVGRAGLSYTKVLGEDAVGRRRMRHLDMGNLSNVITSEVSLVSLLQNTDILSQLTRSESLDDKDIIARIEKMAVALNMVTQGHGNYSMVGQ